METSRAEIPVDSSARLRNSVELPEPISMMVAFVLEAAHIRDNASSAGMKWFFQSTLGTTIFFGKRTHQGNELVQRADILVDGGLLPRNDFADERIAAILPSWLEVIFILDKDRAVTKAQPV